MFTRSRPMLSFLRVLFDLRIPDTASENGTCSSSSMYRITTKDVDALFRDSQSGSRRLCCLPFAG